MSPVAAWYPDPAGSGRQRYFDGVRWTENYLETVTTVYASPSPLDPTPTPAGWYPDPTDAGMRRYWDGQRWTEERTTQEIILPKVPTRTLVVIAAAVVVGFAAMGTKEGPAAMLGGALAGLLVGGPIIWGIWLAFRSDARRTQRQQQQDRDRALAINADAEHSAYLHGDDERGVYGQFPPPPDLRGDEGKG